MDFDEGYYNHLVYNDELYKAMKYRESTMPKKIFKYFSLYDNCELNNQKLKTLEKGNIWLSSYDKFNDPFEYKGYYLDTDILFKHNVPLDYIDGVMNKIRSQFSITCFTVNLLDNMPMWAHYANNHKGFCVEYEVENPQYLYNVFYEKERYDLTNILMNFLVKSPRNVNIEDVSEKDKEWVRYMFFISRLTVMKHRTWSYENEYRIVYPNYDNSDNGINLALNNVGLKISSIYCGIRTSVFHINKLVEIGKILDVGVRRIVFNESCNEYKLDCK